MTQKKPSHSYRLQTMSVPELSEGMVRARMRLNRAGLLHRGRKLKDGPLLNAVVAWYLGRPAAEQDAIARQGLAQFEAILDGEGCGPGSIETTESEASSLPPAPGARSASEPSPRPHQAPSFDPGTGEPADRARRRRGKRA